MLSSISSLFKTAYYNTVKNSKVLSLSIIIAGSISILLALIFLGDLTSMNNEENNINDLSSLIALLIPWLASPLYLASLYISYQGYTAKKVTYHDILKPLSYLLPILALEFILVMIPASIQLFFTFIFDTYLILFFTNMMALIFYKLFDYAGLYLLLTKKTIPVSLSASLQRCYPVLFKLIYIDMIFGLCLLLCAIPITFVSILLALIVGNIAYIIQFIFIFFSIVFYFNLRGIIFSELFPELSPIEAKTMNDDTFIS